MERRNEGEREGGRKKEGREGCFHSLNIALLNPQDRLFIPFTADSCLRVFIAWDGARRSHTRLTERKGRLTHTSISYVGMDEDVSVDDVGVIASVRGVR